MDSGQTTAATTETLQNQVKAGNTFFYMIPLKAGAVAIYIHRSYIIQIPYVSGKRMDYHSLHLADVIFNKM